MIVADKPHASPIRQSDQPRSSQQGQTFKKASKSNDTGKNTRQRQPKLKVQQQLPQPPPQNSKQSGNQKPNTQKSPMSTKCKTNVSPQPRQNNQKQKQNSNTRSSKGKINNRSTDKVRIPPRNVQVDFHSTKCSNQVTLKDTSDQIKKSAVDINDLLPELSINDTPSSATSQPSNQINRNSLTHSLYQQYSLPDGSSQNFGKGSSLSRSSSSCSTTNRSKISSASSYTNDSSNIINSLDNFKYAGSSFAAEPKAVTLPKPSFLKSK